MKVCNKIIPFFMAFAIAFSAVVVAPVTANASSVGSVIVDSASVVAWDNYFSENYILGGSVEIGGIIVDLSFIMDEYWRHFNGALSNVGLGSMSTYDKLQNAASVFGRRIKAYDTTFASSAYTLCLGRPSPTASVAFDSIYGVYRLRDDYSGLWLVNSSGHFPYYRPDTVDDTTGTETIRTGQWVERSKITSKTVLWHVVSNYELNEFKSQWSDVYSNIRIQETDGYYWLTVTVASRPLVLCDKYGYPYYLPKPKETAVTTPQNYYQDTTNQYIDNSITNNTTNNNTTNNNTTNNTHNNYYDYETNEYHTTDNSTNVSVMDGGSALVGSPIDVNNGIINVGGEVQYVDNLTYDASTQSYYVDAHDDYTYNSTTNNYTTNNYTYLVQYHISYTSITYIGTTEEYNKRYELYYELPDGRSSADLTAEDLEQLSTVFADVVQYARSADDSSMRGLYHFDGSTEDSSYWSYCTVFDWAAGASLTYMDEGTFNGSLYLDETEHDFTITLPVTSDLSSDFTIQFRYYQSYTAVPKQDSYIQLGADTVFQFTGSQYLTGSGTAICATGIGNWNEICIVKQSGILHYYINGVYYTSVADNQAHANTIRFYFGSAQQTYKKIDELRITKGAIYTPGEDYAPTSVPYDTNLSLVLPDGDIPIADEVMVLNKAENNLFDANGLSDWSLVDIVDNLYGNNMPFYFSSSQYPSASKGLALVYDTDIVSFSQGELGAVVHLGGNDYQTSITAPTSGSPLNYFPKNSIFFPVAFRSMTSSQVLRYGLEVGKTYTLSVVLADGTSSSLTFQVESDFNKGGATVLSTLIESDISFAFHYCGIKTGQHAYGFSIYSATKSAVEILYMELVEGSEPQGFVSYEQAIYSSGELKDSPVLAVRTNRPIAGYQIGGVRPSYPETGLVYAMVENSRIVSLQQYTGSAWEDVDGRIWTGERWIPYSSFDVHTLQDFYDIIGGSGDDYEYIYTESGFWAWWQKQWNEFTGTLFGLLDKILKSASSSGDVDVNISIENNTIIDEEDKEPFNPDVYKGVIKTLRNSVKLFSGFFGFIYDGVNNFIVYLTDTSSEFYGLFHLSELG